MTTCAGSFSPSPGEMGFVCENGGLNAVGREIVSVHPMDRAAALGITQTLQGLGLSVLLSGVRCCYTLASDRPFCDGMVYGLRNTMTIVDDFSQIDDDFIKLAAYHPGTIEPFMDRLQSEMGRGGERGPLRRWNGAISTCPTRAWG